MKELLSIKIEGREYKVILADDGNYQIHAPDKVSYVGDKRMAAKKLGDFLFVEVDRNEALYDWLKTKLPIDEAVQPYVDHYKRMAAEKGDWVLNIGPQACGCVGPQDDDPECPCALRERARRIVSEQRGYILPPEGK